MVQRFHINVDASKAVGKQLRFWNYIGYDECNYTYHPEGQALLREFAKLGGAPYYVRTHFMFCDGSCTGTQKFGSSNICRIDGDGTMSFDFTYYDLMIDAIVQSGNKPFVELGFMPRALADSSRAHGAPKGDLDWYRIDGWTCPPTDYDKWAQLITAVMKHLVGKYGKEEIASWYFELWNEPDGSYWSGDVQEYCKLFDYTEAAIHAVIPEARVVGPASCGPREGSASWLFLRDFLRHCKDGVNLYDGHIGTRLDCITFHVKGSFMPFNPTAKKAVPSVSLLLDQVRCGVELVRAEGYPELEIVLSEADPDCWAAGGVRDNPNMVFRNTEYYASYVCTAYERIDQLAQEYGMDIKPLAWAFTFPAEECFAGRRTFATQGIAKPVFTMFRVFEQLGDERLAASVKVEGRTAELTHADRDISDPYTGEDEPAAASVMATRDHQGDVQIIVGSHSDDIDRSEHVNMHIDIAGLQDGRVRVSHDCIDADHSNAYAEWVRRGRPRFPQGEEYAAIKRRDGLERFEPDRECEVRDGHLTLDLDMPAHAVSYLSIEHL